MRHHHLRPLELTRVLIIASSLVVGGGLLAIGSKPGSVLASVGFGRGVYAGANNPSGVSAFASATHSTVTFASDYLDSNLGLWDDAWVGSAYKNNMVLGAGMFPSGGNLAAAATGAYNGTWVGLGQKLVADGLANAELRLGIEFDGSWMPWYVSDATSAANFAAAFRQIVGALRQVPGQAFRFDFNPDTGAYRDKADLIAAAWPGDAYVDTVGGDQYDQSWYGGCGLPWNNTATAAQSNCIWANDTVTALNAQAAFASAHAKPIAIPEWGLAARGDGHGLGDDPTFIQNMGSWLAAHNTAWESYFNVDCCGDSYAIGHFPTAAAAYGAAFAKV